jgi:hypothetical protein
MRLKEKSHTVSTSNQLVAENFKKIRICPYLLMLYIVS